MQELQSFIQGVISSFNPEDVFSSFSSFVGSGYIFVIIAAAVIYGVLKKVIKLLVFCGIAFVVWYLCSGGYVDGWIAQGQQLLYNVVNGVH